MVSGFTRHGKQPHNELERSNKFSWLNPLFRLGHFLCRFLYVYQRVPQSPVSLSVLCHGSPEGVFQRKIASILGLQRCHTSRLNIPKNAFKMQTELLVSGFFCEGNLFEKVMWAVFKTPSWLIMKRGYSQCMIASCYQQCFFSGLISPSFRVRASSASGTRSWHCSIGTIKKKSIRWYRCV